MVCLRKEPVVVSKRQPDFSALFPAFFVLVCVAVGSRLQSYPQYVLAIAIISMLVGAALVVLVGLGRCITLASGAIMAIGAYVTTLAVTDLRWPYLATLALAGLAGGLAGWLIAFPGSRFRGHNLAMVTLVFQSVCVILIRESTWLTGGAEGIRVPPPQLLGVTVGSDRAFLILIGVAAAVMMLLITILVHGPFGKNLQAAANNEIAAEAFGVSVRDYLTAAFVVSSGAIAFAGALLAPRIRIIDPDTFGVLDSIFMLAYPIVGGVQSIWGGLLGGGGLRVLPELLRPVADYQELLFATLVIIVVMFFPGGLSELIRRVCGLVIKQKKASIHKLPWAEPSVLAVPKTGHGTELLRLDAIDKHFDALHAVDGVSLLVPLGGIHGLIGPNGAGKTSLFNIISGFLAADSGYAAFSGTSLLELQVRDRIRLGITRTFQNVAVFGQLSCLDNVIIGLGRNQVTHATKASFSHFIGGEESYRARCRAFAALESVGIAGQAHSRAGSLSLGDQRRLELARAIVSDPRLILLDEPVSGVAETEVEGLRELLLRINSERRIAMLVVEHNIPFVIRLCQCLSVMGAGRIVAEGKPTDVISLPSVRQLYFGEDIAA
jgi:ABC-type branched-subunit amino acid transport system ATPase component/ABC-type branched-subunit amino acid transport system permease subunit